MASSADGASPLAGAPPHVFDAVLRLNQAHAIELSHLDERSLRQLVATAFRASVVNDGDAFIISFDQDADYGSPNFRWFQGRFPRFVYIDRLVVAPAARGRGIARRLYEELFAHASQEGHSVIGCEVNLDPPNIPSDAFHRAHGFEEVGRATLSPGKSVRYLAKYLDS